MCVYLIELRELCRDFWKMSDEILSAAGLEYLEYEVEYIDFKILKARFLFHIFK